MDIAVDFEEEPDQERETRRRSREVNRIRRNQEEHVEDEFVEFITINDSTAVESIIEDIISENNIPSSEEETGPTGE